MISKSPEERIIYCIYHIFALFCPFFLPDSPKFLLLSFPVCLRNFLCSVFKGRSASHNYFLFFLVQECFYFLFVPEGHFCRIQNLQLIVLSCLQLKSIVPLPRVSYFLNVKFAVVQTGASLQVLGPFSLACFKNFFFVSNFQCLTITHLGMDFLGFTLLGVCTAS